MIDKIKKVRKVQKKRRRRNNIIIKGLKLEAKCKSSEAKEFFKKELHLEQ